MKNMDGAPVLSTIIWKLSIHYTSFHSSMNQELFEKHHCNQSSHTMQNTGDFRYANEAIHQIDTIRCQQRWNEHKERHW